MLISTSKDETYLYINGLAVERRIPLSSTVELLPARWVMSRDIIERLCESQLDFTVASVFLPRITSQLRVKASTAHDLAVLAWNSVWDAVLLGAFFDCEAICNFQCSTSSESVGPESQLRITNYHLRGLGEAHVVTDTEAAWIVSNFERARTLLKQKSFQEGVHALASYRWHSVARARLALLWSGIEGLFGVESEVVFRLSLYVARFLWPEDNTRRATTFAQVKRLYKSRSSAVHGGTLKGDSQETILQSAQLLRDLLYRCVAMNAVPDAASLAP
jgi:hypothetical protein